MRIPKLRHPALRWSITFLCIIAAALFAISIRGRCIILNSSTTNSTLHYDFLLVENGLVQWNTRHDRLAQLLDAQPEMSEWDIEFTLSPQPARIGMGKWSIAQTLPAIRTYHSDHGLSLAGRDSSTGTKFYIISFPLWIPFICMAALAWHSWKWQLRHIAASRKDRCPHCKYPRAGISPDKPCPECGSALSQSIA